MTEDHSLMQEPAETRSAQSDISFALPPMMTIETAEAVAAVFKELPIAEEMILTLDASHVERLTTPGIQIILSLEKTLAEHGGTLVVNGRQESFVHVFQDMGLQRLLSKEIIKGRS
jgi:anti-anti-sigma regulatory factor